MPYLEIEYRPAYWVHSLLSEIGGTPALVGAHHNWSTSGLLDLAFSLETRIGNLTEILRQVDENLRLLDAEFENATDLASLVAGGYVYRVEKEVVALRRTIIGLNSFVVESRSCFENLARFYRAFVRNYFHEEVSEKGAYAKVAAAVAAPAWADALGLLRHDIVHHRSPWIRFRVRATAPRYVAVLILEYRANVSPGPSDEIDLDSLRGMREHLSSALGIIRKELIERVRSLR